MTTRLREIPGALLPAPNASAAVTFDGVRIALFRVAGAILAIEDACVRCAGSLSDGTVADGVVRCSACGWAYDLATGISQQVPAIKLHTFPVRVAPQHLMIQWIGPGD